MGRSGTSAITRVLSFCGGSLPKRLLGANEGNPTGHWEPLDALKLNETFLRRQGSNWYDPRLPGLTHGNVDSPDGQAFVSQIATFLQDYVNEPLLLIKEPRITALTEFWFSAARRVGFRIAAVIAVRHPAEVAASLATRDGVPIELSDTLWLKYNLLAEQCTRELPRIFVEYPNLLADWKREISRISRALAIDLTSTRDQEIAAFLSPDLRRQRASTSAEDLRAGTPIVRVYRALSMAARDATISRTEIHSLVSAHMRSIEAETAVEQFRKRFLPATFQAAAATADPGR